ncbi:unnamed protein product [Pieris brassicae]|uniref:Salivary secreted peptide n=1 Tax=Pieris brassicae TaxID=7116 RepID=A0A9P0SXZ9_PIEBR|nr:unnamed protein product [Pieris brassicae]
MYVRPVLLVLLTCAVVSICRADNLTVGSNINGQLVHMEKVSLSAIPFKVRTKTVSYNGQQVVKGISAIDLKNSKTKVSIMAGGTSFTYVTLRLKSERGDGLDYQIQIYV